MVHFPFRINHITLEISFKKIISLPLLCFHSHFLLFFLFHIDPEGSRIFWEYLGYFTTLSSLNDDYRDLDDWVHQDDVLEKLWAICQSLFPCTAFFLAHLHPGQLCNLLCTLLLLLLLALLPLLALLLCLHLHLLHPGQESD